MPRTKTTSRTRTTRTPKQELIADSGSYTNLIYGIITVGIIFGLILLTLKIISPKHNTGTITDKAAKTSVADEKKLAENTTPTPTATVNTNYITSTPTPAEATVTVTPTVALSPTKVQTPTPTQAPSKEVKQTNTKEYVVQDGESLWSISEKLYKSGYNWVNLAQANNISNPGRIYKGMKLTVPSVTPIVVVQKVTPQPTSQVQKPQNGTVSQVNKISGDTYTIQHGDDLWDISVRAYGDGYKWTEIARVNNILNPNLIHSGNTLKIPRS